MSESSLSKAVTSKAWVMFIDVQSYIFALLPYVNRTLWQPCLFFSCKYMYTYKISTCIYLRPQKGRPKIVQQKCIAELLSPVEIRALVQGRKAKRANVMTACCSHSSGMWCKWHDFAYNFIFCFFFLQFDSFLDVCSSLVVIWRFCGLAGKSYSWERERR